MKQLQLVQWPTLPTTIWKKSKKNFYCPTYLGPVDQMTKDNLKETCNQVFENPTWAFWIIFNFSHTMRCVTKYN